FQTLALPMSTVTRSPTLHPATPGPSSAIVPATSCPGVTGEDESAPADTVPRSAPQIPAAATATRTQPAGAGSRGTGTAVSDWSGACTCMARADTNLPSRPARGRSGPGSQPTVRRRWPVVPAGESGDKICVWLDG